MLHVRTDSKSDSVAQVPHINRSSPPTGEVTVAHFAGSSSDVGASSSSSHVVEPSSYSSAGVVEGVSDVVFHASSDMHLASL